MSIEEEFLKVQSYEEFDRNREKYKNMEYSKVVLEHLDALYGDCYVGENVENGLIEEVYATPSKK